MTGPYREAEQVRNPWCSECGFEYPEHKGVFHCNACLKKNAHRLDQSAKHKSVKLRIVWAMALAFFMVCIGSLCDMCRVYPQFTGLCASLIAFFALAAAAAAAFFLTAGE